jgi:hypothetical protein
VQQVLKDLLETQDPLVLLEQQDQLVLQVRLERLVPLDRQEQQELMLRRFLVF